MRGLTVFNNVSLDGYFVDSRNDMTWAHHADAEWNEFTAQNAGGGGELVFGRVTYEMMAGFWPTPAAKERMPAVAEAMNRLPKVVFSRTLKHAAWNNTRLCAGDLASEVRSLKSEGGPGMVLLGSGTIVAHLAAEGLIDEFQIAVHPVVLGSGRTLFEGIRRRLVLELHESRRFRNGTMMLRYRPSLS